MNKEDGWEWESSVIVSTIKKTRTYNQDYPEKLSFRIEGQIKSFPGKKELKKFMTTNPDTRNDKGTPLKSKKDEKYE